MLHCAPALLLLFVHYTSPCVHDEPNFLCFIGRCKLRTLVPPSSAEAAHSTPRTKLAGLYARSILEWKVSCNRKVCYLLLCNNNKKKHDEDAKRKKNRILNQIPSPCYKNVAPASASSAVAVVLCPH